MTFIGGLLDHINDLNWFGALDKSIVWLIKWRIGGWMDGWMDGRMGPLQVYWLLDLLRLIE